ncbi:glycerophosphodiester phosphodiesterase family protein [Planomicrobium sp. CPCC 101110]|uniref:glycerophosphodiester phosphodiesterase family protein n=1 Tax=Planomicrobium sp. CPCC 101110 TaxID=2599619 RepID=UPI0011B4CD3B|nr:glycerophosphodiester phosphodiesterase family protein [Planomicrobium sp. CPCC 101110]TWT27567.1 glycerophosphodiester phosphodiesterase [Planomicrobium sp. CPCC 101110]
MKIYANRGSSGNYPENTLAAFRAAAELPIAGIVMNVQLSKDGKVVVIHDERLERTTDGQGYVKDKTLTELKDLNCGAWFSPDWEEERIPTLDEVFDIFQGTDHRLNIELKTDFFPYDQLIGKVIAISDKRGMTERLILSSFNHEDVQKVCRETHVESAILTSDILVDAYDYARVIGTDRIHISLSGAYRRTATDALRKGAIVYVYAGDDLQYAEELQQIGIHGLITNHPEVMLKRLP